MHGDHISGFYMKDWPEYINLCEKEKNKEFPTSILTITAQGLEKEPKTDHILTIIYR